MTFTLSLRIACSRLLNRIRATLLVDPAGSNNSVLYTAKEAGEGGEAISVAYATPATQATTTVAVSTNAITVTPGTKARMVVSGTLTSNGSTPAVFVDMTTSGINLWQNVGGDYPDFLTPTWSHAVSYIETSFGVNRWVLSQRSPAAEWYGPSNGLEAFPSDVATWTPQGSATGTPTVTAGVSSAAQVIAAVNASTPAAALVTASAATASTGPVAAVAADFLALP